MIHDRRNRAPFDEHASVRQHHEYGRRRAERRRQLGALYDRLRHVLLLRPPSASDFATKRLARDSQLRSAGARLAIPCRKQREADFGQDAFTDDGIDEARSGFTLHAPLEHRGYDVVSIIEPDRVLLMHRGRIAFDLRDVRRRQLTEHDLLQLFDQLRWADRLDASAAEMLRRTYI